MVRPGGRGGHNLCGAGRLRIQNINLCVGTVKVGGSRGGCGHDSEVRAGVYYIMAHR